MRSIVRAAFVASLLCSAAAVVSPGAAIAADHLTRDVQIPLAEAQKAMQQNDYQTALAKVKEAQATSDRTPYDDYMINSFLASIYIDMKDYKSATPAIEAAADSPVLPEDQKKPTFYNAFQLAATQQQYDKAIKYGLQLEDMKALDARSEAMLAQAYYETKDFVHAQQYAQMSVDASKAAGQIPTQGALVMIYNSQLKQNDKAGAQKTMEQLAVDYDDEDSWAKMIDIALATKGIKEIDALNMFRLRVQMPDIAGGEDYTSQAALADQLGYSTEAVNALDKAISSSKIGAKQAAGAMTHARNGAALDAKSLPTIAAEAARASKGEEDIKLAEDYWGYGRFADAEAAARRAISKDGLKDPSEGPMLLGMVLTVQGKYDEAISTLAQVNGNPGRMAAAHLWSLYAQAQKIKSQSSAPASSTANTDSSQTPPAQH